MEEVNTKWCRECNQMKSLDAFAPNQYGKDNRVLRRPVCRDCYAKKIKPNLLQKREFELTIPRPPIGENFTCPICLKTFKRQHINDVVLDHNHKDGSIRGWLCSSCNTSLGKFNDDVNILQRAINWIIGKVTAILF